MDRPETQPAPAGGVRLAVPPGYVGRWLSDPADSDVVARWTSASREACLYNAPSYIDFARVENGRADLLWLVRDGNPVLGLPVHPVGDSRIGTGYSGLMFADGPREATLHRGVLALVALLEANPRLGFQVLQSLQASAYDDPARIATLAFLLEEHGLLGPSLYSRMLSSRPQMEPARKHRMSPTSCCSSTVSLRMRPSCATRFARRCGVACTRPVRCPRARRRCTPSIRNSCRFTASRGSGRG